MPETDAAPWESRWTILSGLSSTENGLTYLVEHVETGQQGVMKRLNPSRHETARRNMAKEIVNLVALRGAGCSVPEVIDKNTNAYERKADDLYFVREYIEGESLETLIGAEGHWSAPDTSELLAAVGRELSKAASLDIVHGDLSPTNIILRSRNPMEVSILNFGLTFDRGKRSVLAAPGARKCERFLTLPEFFHYDGSKIDCRSDTAGLAGLAYFCVTGTAPGAMLGDEGLAPHQRDPEQLGRVFSDAKQVVKAQAFFEEAFARNPDDRFQTVAELMKSWYALSPLEYRDPQGSDVRARRST